MIIDSSFPIIDYECNKQNQMLKENYCVVIKGRVCTPVCIMTWRREALSAASSFGHVPLVIWLGASVGHRVIKMTLFTGAKLCCDCEFTITSPAPAAHMASIFQRMYVVGIAMRSHHHFISINSYARVEGLWVFHWVIRINHDPRLFSACILKIWGVWNVVSVPVAKLGNVMRMLLSWRRGLGIKTYSHLCFAKKCFPR